MLINAEISVARAALNDPTVEKRLGRKDFVPARVAQKPIQLNPRMINRGLCTAVPPAY